MKKFFIAVIMLLAINCVYSQNVVREGNTFKTEKTTSKADTTITKYEYEDSKGKHPIIMNNKTGSCYIWKLSKNGKYYKKYLKKEVSEQICRELGLKYKPKSRSGK